MHVPISFWQYAFQYAVYLINRLPTPLLQHRSPLEILYHHSPSYKSICVFAFSCFLFLRPYNHHKLQFRLVEYVLLGFSPHHKGYPCLNRNTWQIYVSRHVVFNEFSFPFFLPSLPPNASTASSECSTAFVHPPCSSSIYPSISNSLPTSSSSSF